MGIRDSSPMLFSLGTERYLPCPLHVTDDESVRLLRACFLYNILIKISLEAILTYTVSPCPVSLITPSAILNATSDPLQTPCKINILVKLKLQR